MAKDHDISKFLSLVLRHAPQDIGLTLDAGGWAALDELIARAPLPLTAERIAEVVAGSDKQRFALSPDGSRIRANQGHSIPVDLGLTPVEPPDSLYHGTAETTLDAILAEGLRPMTRNQVHLSPDAETARKVGMRHGKPVILRVASARMQAEGHSFFLSANGVWLTDAVPPRYLQRDG